MFKMHVNMCTTAVHARAIMGVCAYCNRNYLMQLRKMYPARWYRTQSDVHIIDTTYSVLDLFQVYHHVDDHGLDSAVDPQVFMSQFGIEQSIVFCQ